MRKITILLLLVPFRLLDTPQQFEVLVNTCEFTTTARGSSPTMLEIFRLSISRFRRDDSAFCGETSSRPTPSPKAQCSVCHAAPYYTDNLMHNLRAERFFYPRMINGRMASADGPIKTFPLRGIKDSPPYLHDGRLPTLDDTVEFFNLILGTKLTGEEKESLVAFLATL